MPVWVGPLLQVAVGAALVLLKSLFGTDKPVENTEVHPSADLPLTGGKSDKEKLHDIGI